MTATGRPKHEGSIGWQGLALPWATHVRSGLLYIPLLLQIYHGLRTTICRWSQHHDKDGAYTRRRTYPAIHGDYVEVQQSQGGDSPTASVNCNQFGARLQFAIWADLQLHGVGWNVLHAIVWNKIMCLNGQIIEVDLMITCHMDGSMSGYFPMMDNMSPEGLWDCDDKSMECAHYGG